MDVTAVRALHPPATPQRLTWAARPQPDLRVPSHLGDLRGGRLHIPPRRRSQDAVVALGRHEMREIFAFLMVTADGYHATTDSELFWHNIDAEFQEFALAQLDQADTLLFGRVTYQGMAEFWSSPDAFEADPAMTERMNRYPKVVVSRALAAAGWTPSTLIRADAGAQLARLKGE